MPAIVIKSLDALKEMAGLESAPTEWLVMTQERINQFAEATGDTQWIHVDRERAARESPYGTTIAHGFLTLSLVSQFIRETFEFGGVRMAVNYGLNRVRFPAPVLSGAKIRARVALQEAKDLPEGVEVVYLVTIESEGLDKPCCVAEWVVRYYR